MFQSSTLAPIRVVVTGAAGQIAYSLIYLIGKGDVFGDNQPIILHLLDIPPMMGVLQGVCMEIQDCALPLIHEVVPTDDPNVAFKDVAAAILVGSMPRREGMERKDLLQANVKIFKVQGEAIDKFALKTVKVLVVGNPANTNALVCSHFAPSIPKENFTAMTRLDQNRAQAEIASRLKTNVSNVKNVIIWGNHSSTQFPDVRFAKAVVNGKEIAVVDGLNDDAYLKGAFVETIQKRGAAVIAARKMSSAMSAAKAAGDHMHDIWLGTGKDRWVSMGVMSDGSYNVPKDLIFSFPCTIEGQKWSIVKGLSIDDFAKGKLDTTACELCEERDEAFATVGK